LVKSCRREMQLGQVGSEAELVNSINGFVIHVDRMALLALEVCDNLTSPLNSLYDMVTFLNMPTSLL